MYEDKYSDEISDKLVKIKNKDPKHFQNVRKKMDFILKNPNHRYKYLHHSMKGTNRLHIGHFVLTFIIDHSQKTVSFEDYDHHDNVYER